MHSIRQFLTHRLTWLAVLVALGIGALFARAIWTIRNDEWNYARQTNANLAVTLERGLLWALEGYDQSLKGVAREVSNPEVWELPPELRTRMVFDNSLRVGGLGDVLVLDAGGNVVLNFGAPVPPGVNFAGRDYFTVWRGRRAPLQGGYESFFGKPVMSDFNGQVVVPMSRPFHHPDGSFAGVVVGGLRVSFFRELFGSIDLGESSGINLFQWDGTVISRFPYGGEDVGKSIAGSANLAQIHATRVGEFEGVSVLDHVQRLYSYRQVGQYPLVVSVAQSKQTVLAHWVRTAWTLGSFALLLMLACLGVALLFVRELTLRQQVAARLREAERNLRTILDNMPSMIGYWDAQLRNLFVNHTCQDWYGISPEAMRGKHLGELRGDESHESDLPRLQQVLQGQPQTFERTVTDFRGVKRHTMASFLPDMEGGVVRGIFVQITDISDRKQMEEELFNEKERVRLTLQAIGDAVISSDENGRVTYLNPVAERLTRWQAFDAAGRQVGEVLALHTPGDDGAAHTSALLETARTGLASPYVRGELVQRVSGQRFQIEKKTTPITDRHGQVTGAVAVLRDVTETMAMAERMAHLAQYDALTDLPNRLLLRDRAHVAMAQARRSGKSLAVIYLDLDGFKQVNDSLGHEAGDQLLVQFARRLVACVRTSDTVSRRGGDEFVVLLLGLEGADAACAVARKILAAVAAPFELDGGLPARVGLSGGIALFPQHGSTLEELSRHADGAMYAAKRGGRMRFMLYQGSDAPPALVPPVGRVPEPPDASEQSEQSEQSEPPEPSAPIKADEP